MKSSTLDKQKSSTLEKARAKAIRYQTLARSENTVAAYNQHWAKFSEWCASHNLPSFPADIETVCLFLVDQSETISVPTLRSRVAAISAFHNDRKASDPCTSQAVKSTIKGIAREAQHRPKQAQGLSKSDIMKINQSIDQTDPKNIRDMAMMWTAFSGGLRVGELISLNVEDLFLPPHDKDPGSMLIRKSKTDQEGNGRHAALLPEAVSALRYWLDITSLSKGPLFLRAYAKKGSFGPRLENHGAQFAFKRLAKIGGLNPRDISVHSCRVGVAQELVAKGATTAQVAQACGWKGDAMPARYASQLIAARNAVTSLL